jgi:hypothetical protein
VKYERGIITNISQSTYKPPPTRRGQGEVKVETEGVGEMNGGSKFSEFILQ